MKCIKCARRLKALPGTKTCVNCSGARMKGAVTLMKGEGDHTWIETIFRC
jgi:RNA polymerase-binding transcription factor DksA